MGTDWRDVEAVITSAEATGAVIGVSILTSKGERYSYNGERAFLAASTVKIPIMVRVFQEIEERSLSLDDELTITPQMACLGTGVLRYLHPGLVMTVGDLLYLMISISDNVATNILIDMVGISEVNETMRNLGMTRSNLARKMQGFASTGSQSDHWAIPDEYAQLMRDIVDGKVGTPYRCEQMVELLERQQNENRIGRHLSQTGVRWGSKNGTLEGVINDVGFIASDAGTVIISAYCEVRDVHAGERIIGDIALATARATGVVDMS